MLFLWCDLESIVAVEGPLGSYQTPSAIILEAVAEDPKCSIVPLPWPAIAGSLKRLNVDSSTARHDRPIYAAKRKRVSAVDLSDVQATRRDGAGMDRAGKIRTPSRLLLERGDWAEIEVASSSPQSMLHLRARRLGGSMARLSLGHGAQTLSEFRVGGGWRTYSVPIEKVGHLRLRITCEQLDTGTAPVELHWLEVEQESGPAALFPDTQGPLVLRYLPEVPRGVEEVSLGGSADTISFLSVGGPVRIDPGSEIEALSLADGTSLPVGEDAIHLPELPAGLHRLQIEQKQEGSTLDLRIHQPFADLNLFWQDESTSLPGEGLIRGASSVPIAERILRRLECRGDRRAAFFLPAPGRLSLKTIWKEDERLRFSVGVPLPGEGPLPASFSRDPAWFRVYWQPWEDDAVLVHEQGPVRAAEGWLDVELQQTQIGGPGTLIFETSAEDHAMHPAAVAVPRIVTPESDGRPNVLVYLIDTLHFHEASRRGRSVPEPAVEFDAETLRELEALDYLQEDR